MYVRVNMHVRMCTVVMLKSGSKKKNNNNLSTLVEESAFVVRCRSGGEMRLRRPVVDDS